MTKPLPEVIAESNSRLSLQEQVRVLREALRGCQTALAVLLDPAMQHVSSLHVFAQCKEAEFHARAALTATAEDV